MRKSLNTSYVINYLIIFIANNTIANNIAEENIFNNKTYSTSNMINGDDIVNSSGHLENNYDECCLLKTDIKKNNDINNEQNSNYVYKNDITFNDIIDINAFCKHSDFSHSTCICDILSCNDMNNIRNNTYNKNGNNDSFLCDKCGLNRTSSINTETPIIFDEAIDSVYITTKNSDYDKKKQCKHNANTDKHTNEDNKIEKNFENFETISKFQSFSTTMDDNNECKIYNNIINRYI